MGVDIAAATMGGGKMKHHVHVRNGARCSMRIKKVRLFEFHTPTRKGVVYVFPNAA